MGALQDAVAHHRAGRLQEAAAGYVAVLQTEPEHADALHLLGLVMHRLGHTDEALDLMDRALAVDKRLAPAHANRALVLQALGRSDEAVESLRRALRLRPGFYEANLTLARVHHGQGQLDAAERAARAALRSKPDDAAAVEVLATILADAGDPAGAAQLVVPLLAAMVVAAPQDRSAAITLCDTLTQVADPPSGLEGALGIVLALDGVDHQRLERALRAALGPFRDAPPALAEHPLTAPWLAKTLVQHPDWETAARALRTWLLEHVDEAPLRVVVAMALHGFHTEHAWPTSSEESILLDSLTDEWPRHAAAAAMYRPLAPEWAAREGLVELDPLVQAALLDDAEERELAVTMPVLAMSSDATSAAVQQMYEHNPYPRLVSVHVREPVGLALALRAHVHAPPPIPDRALDVLVAGCGTGQHPLQTATAWSDVDVLGIDLSRRSLARASRRAAALGLDNVTFAQADLLALDSLDRTFDVVESVGVLHHLHDPLEGWRVLRDRVRPGGLMRIGLYSERGRADVVAGRALVSELGLEPTPSGLRALREHVRALPDDHPAHPLVWSPDFTSLSGVRDLVFHVQEHRFTLPELGRAIGGLGLTLLGFQHAQARVPALYRARWPEDEDQVDLARWELLEADHPRIFSGMYVMWLHRPE